MNQLPETPTTHKQLRRLVADQLRSAIVEGQYKPGEWLRQERLAQELGVSQMPVREALKELAAEGLVEHVPYRGVRVVEFLPQDVADLYTHRSFLEGMAAAAAARQITPQEINELQDLQARMLQRLAPEHLSEYRYLNRRFHQVIYTASRRDYLIRTLNQIWEIFPTMLWGNFANTTSATTPARDTSDAGEHEAIIQALQSGNSELAQRLICQHIDAAGQQLLQAIQTSP